MAAIKLHGNMISTATTRVLATLYEKDLEAEFVNVDMKAGEHKKEHFLSKNPFGQVPAFEDGDMTLFESRAITRYICHEYADKGTPLLPPGDSKKKSTISVWMEVEAHQFDPPATLLTWELAIKRLFGLNTDTKVVEENEAKLAKVLDVYETRLAKSKYLGWDCFTLADLHHLPNIEYLMGTRIKEHFDSRPNVSAWVADIRTRPSWLKVLAAHKQ
ncbi:hypothetical protein F2P56_018525 [Juglans regia]|uniref:glutathione transferase n=2 Tax=Juglans regia TaxID=51240 RepID=A0A833V1F7_JUGRE|nr:glutathione S-transferase PARB-like [Juglans regia]KAF5462524.1 hypothetical protein F2P56_018525 [Juglans regia]